MEDNKPDGTKPEEPKITDVEAEKKEGAKEAEKPAEDKKLEEPKGATEAIKEAKEQSLPPPPQQIVLKVFMHCEGCARKVRRCLKGFEGVESVETDCKTHKVVVKGEKADPLKVLDRVQRKSHRQVELISPIPKPSAPNEKKVEEIEKPKTEEKKAEIITVVLKVHMHCEACAQEIKRRMQRMKGVESVDPDLKSSQVTVKGAMDPPALVEYVYKRTGKHAEIVKQEAAEKKQEKEEAKETKEEKKGDDGETVKKGDGGESEKKVEEESKEEKAGGGGEEEAKAGAAEAAPEEVSKVVEVKKNEYYHYPHRYIMEMYAYPSMTDGEAYPPPMVVDAYPPPMAGVAYPPQMFSDENPNACSVM